ncbi:MAG TPA: response regulator transcription factor [Chitinophagaceae bacterium]|nr:response regulator transcription factor [Chitinophagaceae bacterium]
MKETIKVLVANNRLLVTALKSILSAYPNFEVKGEITDGNAILIELKKYSFYDIILIDVNLKDLALFEVIREIRKQYPGTKIILLSLYDDPNFVKETLQMGVKGYILKNAGEPELIDALREVAEDKLYLCEEAQNILINEENGSGFFTKREKEILILLAKQLTTQEIANNLSISSHTVESHRKNMLRKVGAKNTPGLVKHAIENKLL